MKLFAIENIVWAVEDFKNDRNTNPLQRKYYLFASEEGAKAFVHTLPKDDEVVFEKFIASAELDDSKILELSECDDMREFIEMLGEPYAISGKKSLHLLHKNWGEDDKSKVAKFIFDNYDNYGNQL